jgi:hypothetical protein
MARINTAKPALFLRRRLESRGPRDPLQAAVQPPSLKPGSLEIGRRRRVKVGMPEDDASVIPNLEAIKPVLALGKEQVSHYNGIDATTVTIARREVKAGRGKAHFFFL